MSGVLIPPFFFSAIEAVQAKWRDRWDKAEQFDEWLGFGIEARPAGADRTGPQITLFVRTGLDSSLTHLVDSLQMLDVNVEVAPIGGWIALAGVQTGAKIESGNCTNRSLCTGAAGVLLRNSDASRWLLGANHVISLNGTAACVELVVDGPNIPLGDTIHFEEILARGNRVDAAVVKMAVPSDGFYSPFGENLGDDLNPISCHDYSALLAKGPRRVMKFGPLTKCTKGLAATFLTTIRVEVLTFSSAEFIDVFVIKGEDFGVRGDSGSLIVDLETRRPVGMLIAKSVNGDYCVGTYLETSLELLGEFGPFVISRD